MEKFTKPLIPGLSQDVAANIIARVPANEHRKIITVSREWRDLIISQDFLELRRRMKTTDYSFCLLTLISVPVVFPQPLQVFDLEGREGNSLPNIPNLREEQLLLDCACVGIGRHLYVIGGTHVVKTQRKMVVRNEVHRYDSLLGQWEQLANMHTRRRSFACGVIDGCIYVAGGYNVSDGYLSNAEFYNPKTDEWRQLESAGDKHGTCVGAVVGQKFFLMQNCAAISPSTSARVIEVYEVEDAKAGLGRWTVMAEIPREYQTLQYMTIIGDLLYTASKDRMSICCFDLVKRTWSNIGMPAIPHGAEYTVVGMQTIRGQLCVVGFLSSTLLEAETQMKKLYIYDPNGISCTLEAGEKRPPGRCHVEGCQWQEQMGEEGLGEFLPGGRPLEEKENSSRQCVRGTWKSVSLIENQTPVTSMHAACGILEM